MLRLPTSLRSPLGYSTSGKTGAVRDRSQWRPLQRLLQRQPQLPCQQLERRRQQNGGLQQTGRGGTANGSGCQLGRGQTTLLVGRGNNYSLAPHRGQQRSIHTGGDESQHKQRYRVWSDRWPCRLAAGLPKSMG